MNKADHKQIGVYRIIKPLGGGRMGVVYLVEDQDGGGKYALKLLTSTYAPTAQESRRFRREFITLSRLRHPNIIDVYESGLYKDALYFVMEFIQGATLNTHFLGPDIPGEDQPEARLQALNQRRRVNDIATVTYQICDALAWIHNRGIIHRDLKPENMMLKAGNHLKLLDFGIAKRWGKQERTQAGSIMGTFTYISPEQAQCEDVDGRSDLYSLGVILYELLTGRPPFVADAPIGRLYMHLNKEVPPLQEWNPGIPPALENIVLKLLEKDPMNRFQRAEDLQEALATAIDLLGYAEGTMTNIAPDVPVLRIRDAAFVGRDKERTALLKHIEGLHKGEGGLVLLSGHSGIGKTRLMREILGSARSQLLECCTVRCLSESPPYAVYQELMEQLRAVLSMRQDDLPQTLWKETAQNWFGMMQSVGSHDSFSPTDGLDRAQGLPEGPSLDTMTTGSGSGTEEEKMMLFESCRSMLEAVLQQEALIFSLDDLMFADEISLELTEYLVNWLSTYKGPNRLLLLGTFRNEEVGTDHPLSRLLLQLTSKRMVHHYDLKALNAEEVNEMATSMLGLPPSKEALDLLMSQSQGSPLFVDELIKAWDEEGQLVEAGDCWHLLSKALTNEEQPGQSPGQLPATLKKRLLRRLDRLSEEASQVAAWLAVLGQESTFDMLFELCQLPEERFLACLEELLQQKILLEDWSTGTERYRFSHLEIQEALYAQLDEDQRLLSHRKAAYTIKQTNANEGCFELLAHHFLKANESEQGAWYLLLAAEQQLRALAYHSTWELLNQCQQLLKEHKDDVLFRPSSSWWMRVQQAHLELLESTSRYPEGIEHALAALQVISAEGERAPLLRWLASFYRHTGAYKEALETIEQALGLEHSSPELRPHILQEAGRIYRAQGKHSAALEAFREALAWAISKQLAWEEGRLCRMIGRVLHQRGEIEEASAHYTRAHQLAQETKDQRGTAAALCCLAALALDQGELALCEKHIQEGIALADTLGDRRMRCNNLSLSCQFYLERRKFPEAQAQMQAALQLAIEIGDKRMESELMGWQGILCCEDDQIPNARLYLEDGLDKAISVGDRLLELWIRCYLALVDLHQKSRPQREIFEELERILQITEQMEATEVLLLCRCLTGRVLRVVGRHEEALEQLIAARSLALGLGHRRALAHIERERYKLRNHESPDPRLSLSTFL